jgi:hypothetical protein
MRAHRCAQVHVSDCPHKTEETEARVLTCSNAQMEINKAKHGKHNVKTTQWCHHVPSQTVRHVSDWFGYRHRPSPNRINAFGWIRTKGVCHVKFSRRKIDTFVVHCVCDISETKKKNPLQKEKQEIRNQRRCSVTALHSFTQRKQKCRLCVEMMQQRPQK